MIVDLRPESPSFLRPSAWSCTAAGHEALYIPPLCAHGFQTLADGAEVLYQMTDYFAPELAWGARWNDPAFAIAWPIPTPSAILPRDADYPDFDDAAYRGLLWARRAGAV